MAVQLGSIDHLTLVIQQAVAPSFLLGAVVGFISVLFARMDTVIERIRNLNALPDDDPVRPGLKADIPLLRRRVGFLHWSIIAAICAGASATILIVTAFAFALLGLQHIWLSAALFIISLTFLGISLGFLAADVVVVMHYVHHH
jgi:Protein of unknown function (DUF2721)